MFGHVGCMDGKADANQIHFEPCQSTGGDTWAIMLKLAKNITDDLTSFTRSCTRKEMQLRTDLFKGCWPRIARTHILD